MADMEHECTTLEMHTAGEPVRIVLSGFVADEEHPYALGGGSILDKRRYAKENCDDMRLMLMHEPRGHKDMYGVIPVVPSAGSGADLAVLFCHNEGYSTMCGHATIAIGKWAVDYNLVDKQKRDDNGEVVFLLEVPCGLVRVHVEVDDESGSARGVSFESVPSYVLIKDAEVDLPGLEGPLRFDLAFGGAYYAYTRASDVGVDLESSPIDALCAAATAVSNAVREKFEIVHPVAAESDLGFLYGTILCDGAVTPSQNMCVFADAEVDRSPCGSGVQGRMAIQHAAGEAAVGEEHAFEGPAGGVFTGTVLEETTVGDEGSQVPAVVVLVAGEAFYTGRATFFAEKRDALGSGFLLE